MTADLRLRPVHDGDLPLFFAHLQDAEANWMAAFGPADPGDRVVFDAHWRRVRDDPAVVPRTVVVGGDVVGHVIAFPAGDCTEVSYWIDPRRWGRGYATGALTELLAEVSHRPVHARVAKDNRASLAVLRKCGFVVTGEDRGYAQGRGAEVAEWVLELSGPAPLAA
ncbi:GNAT family N-acetyltransferase [Micromonospora sp. WMMA1363]|uniref:GNAT family N-acetyltransferase n=1 Tax=Micromonospora sp. WMMA1363 TaxID=3053985 RepID=UPI00259CD6C5|nr:GNAT family N-acetyltransferase [Micromonospora sp. WMMA1363]MDM4718568.1 GNAT family N-acetyltransferase [Micromonospora sp. WMMA1363]